MSLPTDIPDSLTGLRACKRCSLVKTFEQFYDFGCENCGFLELKENRARVAECTSPFFEGLASIMDPQRSWVAKWQLLGNLRPGCYALEVGGALPEHVQQYCKEKGYFTFTKSTV